MHGRTRVFPFGLGLVAALLLSLFAQRAQAAGEQNARLRGKIIEAGTGVAVPGAKVQIESPQMIGGARSQLTDDDGRFDFLEIPPGRYLITVIFEGIRPVRRRATVGLGETQELNIPFSAEMAQEETTTIVEERQRLNADKPATGRTLTAEQESKIPSARSYQNIVQQVPGVTGGANPVMAGGSFRHNRYLVDGMDVTDPVTNTFSANYNFDTISQVDALTTPLDAEYNSLGGVINLVTKTGSDKFEIDSSFYFNQQSLSSGSRQGTRLYEGKRLQQLDPRPPTASYQFNLNLAGPLIKQKLWFYFSMQYSYNLSSVVPGPPLNAQHPSRISNTFLPHLKLTWAPAPRHRVSLSVSGDPAYFNNLRQANVYAPESEYHQQQGGANGSLSWDWNITDHAIVSMTGGYIFERLYVQPQNGDIVNSAHFDGPSGITFNASDISPTDDQRHRFQLDPKITWFKSGWLGSHTFKLGGTFSYLRHYVLSNGDTGNLAYFDDNSPSPRDPNGTALPTPCNPIQPYPPEIQMMGQAPITTCSQAQYFQPATAQVRQSFSVGGYIQDIWKPTSWFTIIPGLRLDYGIARNSLGEIVQNLLGLSPRIQTTLDLTRDGKTLVKLGYGRASEVSTLFSSSAADTGGFQSTWNFNGTTNRFDNFSGSSGGAAGYDLRGVCQSGPDKGKTTQACGNARLNTSPPRADTVVASIERELYANVRGSISYTYRLVDNQWTSVQLNDVRTLDNSDHVYLDKRFGDVFAYRPVHGNYRRYNGVDFVVEGAPNSNWNFFLSYTLAYLEGNTQDQLAGEVTGAPGLVPRRDFLLNGFLDDDHRHQLKGQASYSIHGLTLGANLLFLTGAPATKLYAEPALANYGVYIGRSGWRGVDPGTDPNDIRKWTELRSPDFLQIDLRAQYDMYALTRQHITLIADLFNALDLGTAVGGSNQVGVQYRNNTSYSTVLNRQAPFRAQFAIRYQWGGVSRDSAVQPIAEPAPPAAQMAAPSEQAAPLVPAAPAPPIPEQAPMQETQQN